MPSAAEERSWLAWGIAGIMTGLLLAAIGVALLFAHGDLATLDRTPNAGVPRSSALEALPVPSAGDVWLARARALHAKGRLHEALSALDGVRMGDPRRATADELRAAIQRALLDAARAPAAAPLDTTPLKLPTTR